MYPPLARQTRISGTVRLHAIIGKDGTIQQLEVMSGHPCCSRPRWMLSASGAISRLFSIGDPVEVDTTIDVIFSLNQ